MYITLDNNDFADGIQTDLVANWKGIGSFWPFEGVGSIYQSFCDQILYI